MVVMLTVLVIASAGEMPCADSRFRHEFSMSCNHTGMITPPTSPHPHFIPAQRTQFDGSVNHSSLILEAATQGIWAGSGSKVRGCLEASSLSVGLLLVLHFSLCTTQLNGQNGVTLLTTAPLDGDEVQESDHGQGD